MDFELLEVLDDLREHLGAPVRVTSGFRCKDHNRAVGGSSRSQHLFGRAADVQCDSHSPYFVQEYLCQKYPNRLGIGRYSTFTHVDTRKNRARWDG